MMHLENSYPHPTEKARVVARARFAAAHRPSQRRETQCPTPSSHISDRFDSISLDCGRCLRLHSRLCPASGLVDSPPPAQESAGSRRQSSQGLKGSTGVPRWEASNRAEESELSGDPADANRSQAPNGPRPSHDVVPGIPEIPRMKQLLGGAPGDDSARNDSTDEVQASGHECDDPHGVPGADLPELIARGVCEPVESRQRRGVGNVFPLLEILGHAKSPSSCVAAWFRGTLLREAAAIEHHGTHAGSTAGSRPVRYPAVALRPRRGALCWTPRRNPRSEGPRYCPPRTGHTQFESLLLMK
jgi:hypothetical protein